ncbi:DapH/DapD/GlmU-related protein [Rhizobium leguminosarum]|uniref:DapH/DapD/GlmU-related protein n=1 Tax=Rhizobium leguminosarum TaxID=384 RepID=UPI001CDC8421|nr:DapH/DapD/GlmU-related protein [Rhizobium leguminosarum]
MTKRGGRLTLGKVTTPKLVGACTTTRKSPDAETSPFGAERALAVRVEDGVWLGGRSTICPGVTIGKNTVVGAGSLTAKDLSVMFSLSATPHVIRAL